MLRSINDLIGYTLSTRDNEMGKCKDVLFDDQKWTVRFLDVDTGGWLSENRVLISPISVARPDWENKNIPTLLTKGEIENSPLLESNAPVSKQWENDYYGYYGWPHYATGIHLWGMTPHPAELFNSRIEKVRDGVVEKNPNLRSVKEVTGYKIAAEDERFGSVKDFLFDDQSWAIRYFVIDTKRWLPSESVLVSPHWVKNVDWVDGSIAVDMTKHEIEGSPNYDEGKPIDKDYEMLLYDYHGRPKYWESQSRPY